MIFTIEQMRTIAELYSGCDLKIAVDESLDTFAMDVKTKTLFIPSQKLKCEDYAYFCMALRHEGRHAKETVMIDSWRGISSKVKQELFNCLEDVRIDKNAERELLGAKRVNDHVYQGIAEFIPVPVTQGETPTMQLWIYGLKYQGMYPEFDLGFTYPQGVARNLKKLREGKIDSNGMKALVESVYRAFRKLYKDDHQKNDSNQSVTRSSSEESSESTNGESSESTSDESNESTNGESDESTNGESNESTNGESSEGSSESTSTQPGIDGNVPNPNRSIEKSMAHAASQVAETFKKQDPFKTGKIESVECFPEFLETEDKHSLLSLINSWEHKGPIGSIDLNTDLSDLYAGIIDNDSSLVFRSGDEEEQSEPGGIIVIHCDMSGSMASSSIGEHPSRNRRYYTGGTTLTQVCQHITQEILELETESVRFLILGYGNRAQIVKHSDTRFDLDSYQSNWIRANGATGGGTRFQTCMDLFDSLNITHSRIVHLIVSDGEWNYFDYAAFAEWQRDKVCGILGLGFSHNYRYMPQDIDLPAIEVPIGPNSSLKHVSRGFTETIELLTEQVNNR